MTTRIDASTTVEALIKAISVGYNLGPDGLTQQQKCIDSLHGELIFNVKALWRIEPANLAVILAKQSLPLLLQSELLKISEMNQLPSPWQMHEPSDASSSMTQSSSPPNTTPVSSMSSVSNVSFSASFSSSSEEPLKSPPYSPKLTPKPNPKLPSFMMSASSSSPATPHSVSSPSSLSPSPSLTPVTSPRSPKLNLVPTLQLPVAPRIMDGLYSPKVLPPIIDDPIFDVNWNQKFKMEDEPEKDSHPICALEKPITSVGITLKQVPFAFIRRGPEPCFVVVFQTEEEFDLFEPIGDSLTLKGLKSTPTGAELLTFQRPDAKGIQSWLQNRFGGPFQQINEPTIIQRMLDLETKAPLVLSEHRVSVVYCRKGQIDPMEMFKNGQNTLSPAAIEFFQLILQINPTTVDPAFLADGIRNNWEDRTFLWHFAPIMTEEQQRSFIGNNNAVIFFKDEGEAFNPSLVGNMGAMPQVFLVVQPFKGQYRIGCFKKRLIVSYKPYIASDFLFTKESCRTTLLTKRTRSFTSQSGRLLVNCVLDSEPFQSSLLIHVVANGLLTSIQCPPLLSLFSRPRQEVIQKILVNLKPPKSHRRLSG